MRDITPTQFSSSVNLTPIKNAILFFHPNAEFPIVYNYQIIPDLLFSSLPTYYVKSEAIFYVFKHFLDNINQDVFPNLPPLNLNVSSLNDPINRQQYEILITKLATQFPYFRTFFKQPITQLDIDQLAVLIPLLHISNKRLRNHLANTIINFNRNTLIVDHQIAKTLRKDQHFAYYIYTLRKLFNKNKLHNSFFLSDMVNFFNPKGAQQRLYTKNKIIKAINNCPFLFKTIHNDTVYYNGINKILHSIDHLSTTGSTYYIPTSFTQFQQLITQTIAAAPFICDRSLPSFPRYFGQPLYGRSIQKISEQSHLSSKAVVNHLKPLFRIHRSILIKSFEYYEDAWEFMKFSQLNHDGFVFVQKSFTSSTRNPKKRFLKEYEVRKTLSNYYVSNAIATKRFIRDFQDLNATNIRHTFRKELLVLKTALSPFKIAFIKCCIKPTVLAPFPFNQAKKCSQIRHNPDPNKRFKYDPSFWESFWSKNTPRINFDKKPFFKSKSKKRKCNQPLKVDVTLPYIHPDLVKGEKARSNFILFVTNPHFRFDILTIHDQKMIFSDFMEDFKFQAPTYENQPLQSKLDGLAFVPITPPSESGLKSIESKKDTTKKVSRKRNKVKKLNLQKNSVDKGIEDYWEELKQIKIINEYQIQGTYI